MIVEEIQELYNGIALKGNLSINVNVDSEVPYVIKSDNVRIRQIISNLLMNAIKFSESGIIEIIVSTSKFIDNEIMIKFAVKDQGIGIPADEIDSLFVKFKQLNSSITKIYKGTGLGLAICKKLTELLGGEIGVTSKINEGSSSWFTIITKVVRSNALMEA